MNNQTTTRPLQLAADANAEILTPRTLKSEFIDIAAVVALLWSRKWFIGGVGFVAALLTVVALLKVPSYYTAEARVLLETRQRQIIDIENVFRESSLFSAAAIASEIALMQSADALRMVAERLELAQYPQFNPALEPASALSGALSAASGALSAGLRMVFGSETADTGATVEPPSPASIAAGILADQIVVAQLGESYVLRIEATAHSPRMAARIANGVAEVYLQRQVDAKLGAASEATEWLASRVGDLRERVERAELQVERLRAEITSDGATSQEVIERQIGELSSRLVAARIANAEATARLNRFNSLVAQGSFGAAMQIATSPQLERLVERRDNIAQQNEALARRAGADGADARQMAETLAGVEASTRQAAAEIARGLESVADISAEQILQQEFQLSTLEAAITAQSSRLIDLHALEREAEAQRQVYETFLSRLTETRARGAFQEPDASISTLAQPPSNPSGPQKGPMAILAAILGSGIAASIMLVRDARRDVLRKPEQVTQAAGAPLMATFRRMHKSTLRAGALRRFLSSPSRDAAVAADRLAAGLLRAAQLSGRQVLMITSALPREGATALSVLVGRALAIEGHRVVIVDCDTKAGGFLKSLAQDVGAPTTIEDFGFDLMRLPDRKGSPLRRVDVREILARLRGAYDVVILDLPPVLASADCIAVAGEADAAILVARIESTPRGALAEAASELRRVGAPVVGVVATSVDAALSGFHGYTGAGAAQRAISQYQRQS